MAKVADYDLAIRGMSLSSEDRFLAIMYVPSQLRDETKLLPILHCPVIGFAMDAARFIRCLDFRLVRHITEVVALKRGDVLDMSEEASLANVKEVLERRGARKIGKTVKVDVRLPDDSRWE